MIDLGRKVVIRNGKEEPITRFAVEFQTPFGLYQNLDDAIKTVVERDLEPMLCVRPVSIAYTNTTYEICGS